MKNKVIVVCALIVGIFVSVNANAEIISKYGYIKRVLTEGVYYGGCMIQLDTPIENGCTTTWVSLDCAGNFYDKERGAQKLSNALAAAHAGKRVHLYIDNTKKLNNYCVARRIDTLF